MFCNVVNYVNFFYLDRQRQDRAQATFWLKLKTVRDSLRAAHKILLFFYCFSGRFLFLFVSLKNTSLKGAAKEIAVLPSHAEGFTGKPQRASPSRHGIWNDHVLQPMVSNTVAPLLL